MLNCGNLEVAKGSDCVSTDIYRASESVEQMYLRTA